MLKGSIFGYQAVQGAVGGTAANEFGVSVTCSSSTHTKGSWAEVISSSSYNAYGIAISISNINTAASTNVRFLCDIGIGAASSEQVLIPNLTAGNTGQWAAASASANMWFFPIFIAAGSRISARAQSNVSSKAGTVCVWLMQWPIGSGWVGSRVTAYGASEANSYGTSVAQSTTDYGATAEITSSCTNPIKYIQLGVDLLADTTSATKRGIVRIGIGSTPTWIVSDLPFKESTTVESINFSEVNFILSQMRFNIPAATRLCLATRTSSAENRGWIIYGVD